ncbi:MAG: hypothetical protein O3C54_05340 [Proteobacteria bacterium]|nr:hypothetical protein [Pseudomonadota bacterium]MDA1056633.1 hypothetical protein [Pseudomonadota bacterium]
MKKSNAKLKIVENQEVDLAPSVDAMHEWRAGKTARQSGTELFKAEEVMFDVFEQSNCTDQKLKSVALKALKSCPVSTDAINLLAQLAPNDELRISLYRKAMEAAEILLGEKYFEETKGEFWGFIETRPYMRAIHGLAETLWDVGLHDDSIMCFQEMLELNPGDNQGIRYVLASKLVQHGHFKELGKLLKKYKDDGQANWPYTEALYYFQKDGDCEKSRKCLKQAYEHNEYVPKYILGKKRLPKELPPYMSFGGEDEALVYVYCCKDDWNVVTGAKDWFEKTLAG